jgi:hypothetical protein
MTFSQQKIMRSIVLPVLTTVLVYGINLATAAACTNVLVTKGASADGSTMITYTADSAGAYAILTLLPAQDYKAGEVINIPDKGNISQVSHTYQVLGSGGLQVKFLYRGERLAMRNGGKPCCCAPNNSPGPRKSKSVLASLNPSVVSTNALRRIKRKKTSWNLRFYYKFGSP